MIRRAKSGTIPITVKTAALSSASLVAPPPAVLPFVTDSLVRAMVSGVLTANDSGAILAPVFSDDDRAARLYQADALELLPRFAPESFDLVFADPPYFLSGGGMTCQSGKRVSVNKGAWDEPTTLAAMHEFNRVWLAACYRLLKPNGTLFVTGTHHNIHSAGFALLELGYKILNDIAWHKVNPPPNLSCRYFTHATETILWARKNTPDARHYFDYAAMKTDNGGKQMQSLWHIAPPPPREKRYGKHPTQKPEALLDRIIRAATREGDAVLDPFCGSGTTGVVCARLRRGFVGIDREPEYLARAAARMRDEPVFAAAVLIMLPTPTLAPEPVSKPVKTWAERVAFALTTLGGEAHLSDINRALAQTSAGRQTATWTCTVRRVVRESPRIEPIGRGRYRLREAGSGQQAASGRGQLALPV